MYDLIFRVPRNDLCIEISRASRTIAESMRHCALQVTEVPKMSEENRLSFKLRRTSFLRDSNFNYNNNDVVDV